VARSPGRSACTRSRSESAARSAARSLDGAFSKEIDALAAKLVDLRLLVEATLDFPDEEIEFLERAGARRRLADAAAQIEAVLATARQGVLLRDGMRVVLAGQPNVGKSSLLNALAGAELAIVTAIPGTTRDKVGETIQIEGVPIHVVDTAGLREAGDEVERIGIARSWSAIEQADVIVFLHDLTRIGEAGYDAGEARIATRLDAVAPPEAQHDSGRGRYHRKSRRGFQRLALQRRRVKRLAGRDVFDVEEEEGDIGHFWLPLCGRGNPNLVCCQILSAVAWLQPPEGAWK